MIYLRLFLLLAALSAIPAQAASGFFKDKSGDLKVNEPAFKCLDITAVKVTYSDKKTFNFEVTTRAPINVPKDDAPYFIVAVNLDGDVASGTSAWTPGQDWATFINLEGSSIKDIRTYHGDKGVLGDAKIENNTLSFTLKFDATKQKRITFSILSMIKRQSADGKVPYTVLDSSVPDGERFNELKL